MILTVTLNPAIDKAYEVESFTIGEVFRPKGMWATAGGKGLNVSRVAAILGERVMATGFLGGGNGQFIRSRLKEQGIVDGFVDIEGESRICIAINDPILDTSTEVLEAGPTISIREQREFLDNFKNMAKEANIITISGSLPSGVPINFYGRIIQIAQKFKKKVLLDTSGQALSRSLEFRPFMIKPNETELGAIVGKEELKETEILKSATKIHQMGIALVCVTLGEGGCIAVADKGAFKLQAPPIDIISTVGSGDSFIAGSAVALARGDSLEDALKLGMACGMANTQFPKTGHVSKELVERYFDIVDITPIF